MKKRKSNAERKCYTVSIPVGRFWLVILPLAILLAGLGAIGGFFFADLYVMPRIVGVQRDMVEIPDVRGKQFDDARNTLFGIGLLTERRDREFNDEVAEGAVIMQFPEAGETVKKGRTVSVSISRGAEVGTVPQVRGMNERQARNELRRSGFSVGRVTRTFSNTQPLDAVIETTPPAETTTSRALNVDLVISRGVRPTHAEVPNLIGETLSEARKKIEEASLRVGRVTTQTHATLTPGSVISQSSAPGSKVPFESAIDLVVSATR